MREGGGAGGGSAPAGADDPSRMERGWSGELGPKGRGRSRSGSAATAGPKPLGVLSLLLRYISESRHDSSAHARLGSSAQQLNTLPHRPSNGPAVHFDTPESHHHSHAPLHFLHSIIHHHPHDPSPPAAPPRPSSGPPPTVVVSSPADSPVRHAPGNLVHDASSTSADALAAELPASPLLRHPTPRRARHAPPPSLLDLAAKPPLHPAAWSADPRSRSPTPSPATPTAPSPVDPLPDLLPDLRLAAASLPRTPSPWLASAALASIGISADARPPAAPATASPGTSGTPASDAGTVDTHSSGEPLLHAHLLDHAAVALGLPAALADVPPAAWPAREGHDQDGKVAAALAESVGPDALRARLSQAITDLIAKQALVLRLAKALFLYGCPSYRLEHYMRRCCRALGVEAQWAWFPNLVLVTFGDPETHTSETHFLRCSAGYDMRRLRDVGELAAQLPARARDVAGLSEDLRRIAEAPPLWPWWARLASHVVAAGLAAGMFYGGSWASVGAAAVFGLAVGVMCAAADRWPNFGSLVEFVAGLVVGFGARLAEAWVPGTCFMPTALGGTIWMLPGLMITIGVMEVASRNLVKGTVRLFHALLISVMIGYGLSIGSKLATWAVGNVTPAPCAPIDSRWALLFFLPVCVAFYILLEAHPRQMVAMAAVTAAGFATTTCLPASRFDAASNSAIAALVVGVCGNAYGRLAGDVAVPSILAGILFLVPGGVSVRANMALLNDDQVTGTALAGAVVEVALGILVGLFSAHLLVFPIGRGKPWFKFRVPGY